MTKNMSLPLLSRQQQVFCCVLSFSIVAFGQPAWLWWLGLLAAMLGYAIFWRVLLDYPSHWHRFGLSVAWFTAVQLVQLNWLVSHPYLYIYSVYLLISLLLACQFGLIGILIRPAWIANFKHILAIASIWTLCEWSRLFLLSGFSWNPVGIALSGSIYPLQMASVWGVYGLSFWVIFVNLLALRAWMQSTSKVPVIWLGAALIPYLYGAAHLYHHNAPATQFASSFHALLVHTHFPSEGLYDVANSRSTMAHSLEVWRQVLKASKGHVGKSIDLMVLPEYTVPYGTYTHVFPYEEVRRIFDHILGSKSLESFPPLEWPFSRQIMTPQGPVYFVNNAFWSQALANYFSTGVVIGLEDVDYVAGQRQVYSAALYFQPNKNGHIEPAIGRYEKRILVPMGEYVPLSCFQTLAASYGITGSFTSGKESKIFFTDKLPFGLSICYEETFGDIMRDNKRLGAALLVNITSDSWYPNSRLPMQHFSHARFRTVENGMPLLRASNMGISGAVDSLGRIVGVLKEEISSPEDKVEIIHLSVPVYNYKTLYSILGDRLIIAFSIFMLIFSGIKLNKFN